MTCRCRTCCTSSAGFCATPKTSFTTPNSWPPTSYAARKVRSQNQAAAAAAIGVSVATISNIEHCKSVPKPETFENVCRYIGTTTGEYALDP